MILRKFYRDHKERSKERKRYRLKQQIIQSFEKKYMIYFFKSKKHLYVQLIMDDKTAASASTLKGKRADKNLRRYQVLEDTMKLFASDVKKLLPDSKLSQFLYDISYYKYAGCIKIAIESFRKHVS